MKKILSLLVALAMLVAFASACKLTEEPAAPAAPAAETPSEGTEVLTEGDLDLEAVAAEVGDKKITLGDVKQVFDSYIEYFTYYGYDIAGDPETLRTFQDDIVNLLINEELPIYKAGVMGYGELTAEQQAELDVRIEEELADLESYYREQATEEAASDVTIDVDMRTAELILEEAAFNLGKDDATYEEYSAFIAGEEKSEYIAELLKNDLLKDVVATEDEVRAEYDRLVAEQTTTYTDAPDTYLVAKRDYETAGQAPVVYAPEGYSRILEIFVAFEGELPEEYTTAQTTMDELKHEYSDLFFEDTVAGTKDNAARLDEIVSEYLALETANSAIFDEYSAAAREEINAAYAELESGADFREVMLAHSDNTDFTEIDVFAEKGMLITLDYAADYNWNDVVKAEFGKLTVGTYSAAFEDVDGYHIIYYLADETPGAEPYEQAKEGLAAVLLETARTAEWDALMTEWRQDGSVVLHEDVYRILGTLVEAQTQN